VPTPEPLLPFIHSEDGPGTPITARTSWNGVAGSRMPPASGGPSRRTRVTGPIWTRSSGWPGRQRSAQNCPGWPERAGVEGEVRSACGTACRRSRLRRRPMTTITIRPSATPANQADSIVRPGEPSCSSMLSGSESAASVGASLTQDLIPLHGGEVRWTSGRAGPLAGRISGSQGRTGPAEQS
jgi:hypothetical protein